jgi:hypothetical protein
MSPDAVSSAAAFEPVRPRRRWLRFGLRTLLALMVLAAIPLAWKVNRAHKQRRAIAAIEQAGGTAAFDMATYFGGPEPAGMRDRFGREFFDDVVRVELVEPTSEAPFAHLPNLVSLSDLTLHGDFQEESLLILRQLDLRALSLSTPTLSEQTMVSIESLPNLESLLLVSEDLTDAKLARLLDRLPQVKTLHVASTQLTDASLSRLARCNSLQWAEVWGHFDGQASAHAKEALPQCRLRIFNFTP